MGPTEAAVVSTIFFFSGMSALVYQTLWQRMMTLAFGASAPASTAILTSFFLGLGLGTLLAPKLVAKVRSLLLLYAAIELWIAVAALAVPALLRICDSVYVGAYPALENRVLAYQLLRFGLSVVAVLPATLAMGVTIPVMSQIYRRSGLAKPHSISLAYGLNTLGSVLGCLLTGFLLIESLGVQRTYFFAVGLNLLVVLTALAFRTLQGHGESGRDADRPSLAVDSAARTPSVTPWLVLYFASGVLAIGYEIVWLRILSIYNSSSIVTFTLTLAVYLLGFAFGSLVLFRFLSPRFTGQALFALSHLGAGASATVSVLATYWFPSLTFHFVISRAQLDRLSAWDILLKECLTALILIFPTTVFLGMSFPALCQKLDVSVAGAARLAAKTYSIGTFGAALGSLVFGLVLVSSFGLVKCAAILSAASLVIALLALFIGSPGKHRMYPILVPLCTVLILANGLYAIRGKPHVALGTLERVGGVLIESSLNGVNISGIVRYKEGNSATVIIKESRQPAPGVRRVFVDDQLVASTDATSKIDAKMLAHLPLLLHPNPALALTVGFGSGGTSWSMTRHGIATEAVEIEPEVVSSAHLLATQNFNVLDEENMKVILDDARNYLHVTRQRFDVISTDVTNLQYKQNPYLYTQEYFALMKERLTASGIACAWVPMAAIKPAEFKTLLKTFASVFPHSSLWVINHNFTTFGIFIGTPEPLKIDMKRLDRAFKDEKISADLREIGINHRFQIPGFLQLDEQGIRKYVGSAPIHTDDRPVLEFTSPVSFYLYAETFYRNLQETMAFRPLGRHAYTANIGVHEQDLFERYTRTSHIWSAVMLNMAAGLRRETLSKAIELSKMALNLVPDQPVGARLLRSLLEAELVR
jgi:spermidine synthase